MAKPIRVLRVVGRMDRGGLETIIMNTYRKIDRDKFQYDFIMHTEEECAYSEEIRLLGGRIYSIPRYNGRNHFQYVKSWNNFFAEHTEYQIVHGHVRSTAAIYLPIAKKFGLTTIAHSHNTSSGTGLSAIVKDILQRPIRNCADYLFACSTAAGKWLFGENVTSKENFQVIPNGIDVKKYQYNVDARTEIRNEFGLTNEFVVGHVGRFHKQKNHNFLLSVFKQVNNDNSNTVLMLVGEGDLREEIESEIERLGLSEKVILTGSRNDVHKLMQAMDIFVFPSLFEGFGNVVIEAQAASLPCIISKNIPLEVNLTNIVEFMDVKGNILDWSNEIIETLIAYERNEKIAEEVSRSGYDIDPITKWYEQFYSRNTRSSN